MRTVSSNRTSWFPVFKDPQNFPRVVGLGILLMVLPPYNHRCLPDLEYLVPPPLIPIQNYIYWNGILRLGTMSTFWEGVGAVARRSSMRCEQIKWDTLIFLLFQDLPQSFLSVFYLRVYSVPPSQIRKGSEWSPGKLVKVPWPKCEAMTVLDNPKSSLWVVSMFFW